MRIVGSLTRITDHLYPMATKKKHKTAFVVSITMDAEVKQSHLAKRIREELAELQIYGGEVTKVTVSLVGEA